MKVDLTGGGVLVLAGLAAVGLGAWWIYSKRGTIAKAAEATVAAVNPADSRNLANSAVSSVGAAVTGDNDWTLGGQLAEWFDPTTRAANESLRRKPDPALASKGGQVQDTTLFDPYSPFFGGS